MKFYFLVFAIFCVPLKLTSQELSKQNLRFEEAWITKNIADQIFIKNDITKFSQAKIFYEKAKNTLEKIDEIAIVNSNYYYTNSSQTEALISYIKMDIDYRLLLLENNIDYWGLEYHQKVLLPNEFATKYTTMFEDFEDLHDDISKWFDELDDDKDKKLQNTLRQLKSRYNQRVANVDMSQYEREIQFYDNQMSIMANSYKKKMEEGIAVSKDAETILKDIETTEEGIMNNLQKAAVSYFSSDFIDGDVSELNQEWYGNINNLSAESSKLIQNIAATTTGFQELLSTAKELYTVYKDVKNVIELGNQINSKLKNGNLKFADYLEIGLEVSSKLKLSDATNELGIELEQKLKWASQTNQFINEVGGNIDLTKCLESNSLSVDCIQDKLGKISDAGDLLDKEYLNWLKNQGKVVWGNNNSININSMVDSLGLKEYLELSKEIVPNLEELKKYETIINSLNELEKDKYKSIYKIGDIIFNNDLNDEMKKKWKDFVNKTKSLKILMHYLDNQNSVNFENLYFSIIENQRSSVLDKIVIEHASLFISNYDKSGTNKELNKVIEKYLIENHFVDFKLIHPDNRFFRNITQAEYSKLWDGEKILISNSSVKAPKRMKKLNKRDDYELDKTISLFVKLLPKDKILVNNARELLISNRDLILTDPKDLYQSFIKNQVTILLNSNLSKDDEENLYKLIIAEFNLDETSIDDYVAKLVIGTNIQTNPNNFPEEKANYFKAEIASKVPKEEAIGAPQESFNKNDALAKQAIVAALNYYYPGLGQVALAIDGYFSVNDGVKQYKELHNRMSEISKDLYVLEREISKTSQKRDIIFFEMEKTKLSQQLYSNQNIVFSKMEGLIKKTTTENRLKIREFLPFYYYLSEKLREQYLLMNKALKFWKGKSFQEMLVGSANNLKYAIDPDIQLFEMFNHKHIGKRTNTFGIYSELFALNNLISSNKEIIKFSKLDYDFKTKKFPLNKNGDISFSHDDFNSSDLRYNKRIVAIKAKLPSEDFSEYENKRLVHSGMFTVSTEKEGVGFEVLDEVSLNLSNIRGEFSINTGEDEIILKDLNRTDKEIKSSFVGYGAASSWKLHLDEEYNVNDSIQIQIMYIYNSKRSDLIKENDLIMMNYVHPMFIDSDRFEISIRGRDINFSEWAIKMEKEDESVNDKQIDSEEINRIIKNNHYTNSDFGYIYSPIINNENE